MAGEVAQRAQRVGRVRRLGMPHILPRPAAAAPLQQAGHRRPGQQHRRVRRGGNGVPAGKLSMHPSLDVAAGKRVRALIHHAASAVSHRNCVQRVVDIQHLQEQQYGLRHAIQDAAEGEGNRSEMASATEAL